MDNSIAEIEGLLKSNPVGNVNKLNDLLKFLDDDKKSFDALHGLRRSFIMVFEKWDLMDDSNVEEQEQQDASGAVEMYKKFVWGKYCEFVMTLIDWIDSDSNLQQVAGLRTLLHFVKKNETKKFDEELFYLVVRAVVACEENEEGLNSQLLRVLGEEFFESYVDVCYHTYGSIERLCKYRLEEGDDEHGTKKKKKTKSKFGQNEHEEACEIPMETLGNNVYYLLSILPTEFDEEKLQDDNAWWKIPNKKKKELPKRMKSVVGHRNACQSAWITFLQLKGIPHPIYRKVLLALPERLIPHIGSPLLLSDFLTDAYEIGGATSMLALNSLFILISQHGLDYPDFYPKLYRLLDFDLFHAKYRAQFFKLMDTFLSSSHLAGYFVAAFAKKICRLALKAPPSAAMFAVVFVSNLLKKHPASLELVHRPTKGEVTGGDAEESEKQAKLDAIKQASLAIALGGKKRKVAELEETENSDVFNMDEPDPAKSNAQDSCLWELDTLAHHYCPNVAILVKSLFYTELKESLETKKIQPQIPIADFTDITYKTLFDQEIKRSRKNKKPVPMTFKNPYDTLDNARNYEGKSVFKII